MPLVEPREGQSVGFHVYPSLNDEATLGLPDTILWSSIRQLQSRGVAEAVAEEIHGVCRKRDKEAVGRNLKLYIQQASEFYEAASISLATGNTPTFAGCLRNAKAVARAASQYGQNISVIPCGERWQQNNSLRPAFEDLIGAGAIISHLEGSLSPEAHAAVAVFNNSKAELIRTFKQCSSGKELISMGYEEDIPAIAQIDVDDCAPILKDGAYIGTEPRN